jgi:hypothetical protein
MSDLSKADAVAALRRIARTAVSDDEYERMIAEDYAVLRAVVAALEQAVNCKMLNEVDQLVPGWHIPVPRMP